MMRNRAGSKRSKAHNLTKRKIQVLRLIVDGHTNGEIARNLKVSVRTVEMHRYQIMQRLNAHNVAQLLRRSLQHRLVSRQEMLRGS